MQANKQRISRAKRKSKRVRRLGGCSGECKGSGFAAEVVLERCPENCKTHKFLAATIEKAKKEARMDALKKCQEKSEPDCLCTGGTYTADKIDCKEFWYEGEGYKCVYTITYIYEGTCKVVN
jgi:hypothetical protein